MRWCPNRVLALLVGVVGLTGIFVISVVGAGTKPEDRSPHREAAPVGGWEFTTFDCLHSSICWDTAGYTLCAEGAEIVDTGIEEFGDRSLSPTTCGAADEPSFMLRFEPLMTSIMVLELTLPTDSLLDRAKMFCWADAADVGDESLAVLLEPAQPMAPGEVLTEGRMRYESGPAGFAACRIYGVVDNFAIYAL